MTQLEAQHRASADGAGAEAEQPIALIGARFWNGVLHEARAAHPSILRIEKGRIIALGDDPVLARNARAIYLENKFVIPGLVDAHIHLCLDPSGSGPNQSQKPDESAEGRARETDRRGERALRMLRAGITTARDLGAGDWMEVDLRDAIESGLREGPRLLCAGQPVTTPGGHCHFWGGEVSGIDAARALIDRQVERGVDWIKVMATGGVFTKGTRVADTQFESELLRGIVEHATACGLPVAAHCHGTRGIAQAAEAGVRTVEHCSFAGSEGFGSDFDPAVATLLAERGTWVSPTVNANWGLRIEKEGRPTKFFERMSHCLGGLREAGVPMLASTDAGIPGVDHPRLPEGLAAFARYASLSPEEALRSATTNAARGLGLEGDIGSLDAGTSADLVVLDADPLRDLSALLEPHFVMARGRSVPGSGPGAPALR